MPSIPSPDTPDKPDRPRVAGFLGDLNAPSARTEALDARATRDALVPPSRIDLKQLERDLERIATDHAADPTLGPLFASVRDSPLWLRAEQPGAAPSWDELDAHKLKGEMALWALGESPLPPPLGPEAPIPGQIVHYRDREIHDPDPEQPRRTLELIGWKLLPLAPSPFAPIPRGPLPHDPPLSTTAPRFWPSPGGIGRGASSLGIWTDPDDGAAVLVWRVRVRTAGCVSFLQQDWRPSREPRPFDHIAAGADTARQRSLVLGGRSILARIVGRRPGADPPDPAVPQKVKVAIHAWLDTHDTNPTLKDLAVKSTVPWALPWSYATARRKIEAAGTDYSTLLEACLQERARRELFEH